MMPPLQLRSFMKTSMPCKECCLMPKHNWYTSLHSQLFQLALCSASRRLKRLVKQIADDLSAAFFNLVHKPARAPVKPSVRLEIAYLYMLLNKIIRSLSPMQRCTQFTRSETRLSAARAAEPAESTA